MSNKEFNLNDFYNNLNEAFVEMEAEYVNKEQYHNAAIMLEAQKQLQFERELYEILDGNNIIYSPPRPKNGHKRFFN